MIIFILLFGYDSLTFSEDFSLEFYFIVLRDCMCGYVCVEQEEFKYKKQSTRATTKQDTERLKIK